MPADHATAKERERVVLLFGGRRHLLAGPDRRQRPAGGERPPGEQWGRRWITCDTSRVALALARTRLMAAKYPYYLLADSPEGIKKEMELTGKMPPEYKTADDIRKGFVYKRAPHVTLKSIANNPDIKEGMTREQIDAAISPAMPKPKRSTTSPTKTTSGCG